MKNLESPETLACGGSGAGPDISQAKPSQERGSRKERGLTSRVTQLVTPAFELSVAHGRSRDFQLLSIRPARPATFSC